VLLAAKSCFSAPNTRAPDLSATELAYSNDVSGGVFLPVEMFASVRAKMELLRVIDESAAHGGLTAGTLTFAVGT
jgi:hypothetical protein